MQPSVNLRYSATQTPRAQPRLHAGCPREGTLSGRRVERRPGADDPTGGGSSPVASYNPKDALKALLSRDARKLFDTAKDEMTAAEKRLSRLEWRGVDSSYARAALYELD